MNIEELDEFLEEKFHMELLSKNKCLVNELIEGLTEGTKAEELKEEHDSMLRIIKELKPYRNYYYYYAVDILSCLWGQGYVVVDENNNYIEFVRTI
jgi:hypothetical protein